MLFYGGESCTITEKAPPEAPPGVSYSGPAVIDPATIEPLPKEGTVDVVSTTGLVATGLLAIDATTTANDPEPGDAISFELTIDNTGEVDALEITAAAELPPALTDLSLDGGSLNGDTVTWTGVDVHADATVTFTVTGTLGPTATGALTVAFGIGVPEDFDPVDVSHPCVADPSGPVPR